MNGLLNVRKIRTQSGRQSFARHWATWRPCYCSLDARRILTIRENDLETADDEIPLKNATADRHHYSKDGYCVIIRTSEEQSSRDTALEIVLQCPNEETAKQWHNALQKCIDELAEIQRRNMQQAMTAFNSFMEERRALQERVGMSALSQENGVDPVYHHDSEVGKKHINFGRDMEPDNTTWVSAEFGELYSHALEQDNYEQRNTIVTEDDVEEEFGDDFVVVAEDDFTPNTTPANRSFWQSYRKSDSSKVHNLENASLIRNTLWNTSGLLQTTKTVETDHAANHHSSVMLMSTTIPFWKLPLPRLRIVIMAVGTRGDVQPFALLGRRLQQDGHRVRLATHSCYRGYVESMGLEYYPLAGDPVKLSEFMVKSHGCILPTSGDVLREVPTNVLMLNDILISTWGACTEADPGDALHRPFTADAIISNPVTYGHIHCAEALGVPLHLMFPQPWVSTKAFPHPLACMSYNNTWTPENYMSYQLVDCMLWLSLEPFVNSFRRDVLGLQPIRRGEHGWNLINANKVPFVKMWSRHLVPKPKDWGSHIDVVGFFFDDESEDSQKSEFDPPSELASFLRDGSPAIFVGFGSMVIDDASSLVQVLLDCAALLNIRIIVQSGWSSISSERFLSMCQIAEHLAISSDFALDDVSGASSASAVAQYLREPESGSDSEGDLIFTTALSSGDVPPFDETSHRVELTHDSNNSNPYFSRQHDAKHSIDHVNLNITTESPESSPASSPFQSPRSSNKSFRTMNSTPRSRWRASDALLIGACPHDWLFRHVAAVVHHGGAGTTAAGLRAGRPTMICPFFGDQHFWGQMVYRSGCGPEPCPLSHEIVMQSFTTLLSPSVSSATQQIAEKINSEHGVDAAVKVFYKHLPLTSMVCDVSMYNGESRLAHVYCRTCKLKMCREASNAVHNREDMRNHIIVPCAYAKWGVQQPTDAVTGLFQGLGAVSHELAGGMVDVVYHPVSAVYTEGIGGLASGLVTGLKCLLYRPYMGGIVLAQKMKQGLSGLTSDAGLVLEKSGALSRGVDDCYDDNRSDIIIDQPQSLPFTLNVNDTDDLVPPSDELVPSHGGYSTLLQRGDTTGISLKNLNDRNRNNAILSAYNSAIRVQESLKAIGGDESRIISFDAFSKLISGALHQPENKSTSATALLIEALSRKKQYMDFVDFSLFYLLTVNEGVKMWKNEPKRIIELD